MIVDNSSVTLSFEITTADYTHVLRWNLIWRRVYARVITVVCLFMGIFGLAAAYVLSRRDAPGLQVIYIVGYVCIACSLLFDWLIPYWCARSIVRSRNSTAVSYTISESGFYGQGTHSNSHIGWPDVANADELKKYFVVQLAGQSFIILPKRAMLKDQQSILRAILVQHLGPKAKLYEPSRNGFPISQ